MDVPPMDALGGEGGMGDVPSMPMDNQMPMDDGSMNDQMPMDDGMNGEVDGFDAGVEADPESDPKKYLQQLTGKLSQELRKYNNEQEQPDEDLNKYIAGMIVPQAAKGMTDSGKKEIIKKIKSGVTDEDTEDDSMQMESITEIVNNVIDDEFAEKRREKRICNKTLPKKNPFRSNR